MSLVGVVGLGVAGLPLAVNFGLKFTVKGVDKDEQKVKEVNDKVYSGNEEGLQDAIERADIEASTDLASIKDCDLVVLCLPSDSENFNVIDGVIARLNNIYRFDVVISSTVPPGFTRKMQEKYGNVKISYVPMRTFEGKAFAQFLEFPHIIGVFDDNAYERISRFYKECGCETVMAKPPEKAELAKLFSNSFRQNEIAIANELAIIAGLYGTDSNEVISITNEGDPNRRIKHPGVWGGYCLGKDTVMLAKAVEKDHGYKAGMLYESEDVRLQIIKRKAGEIKRKANGGLVCIEGIACKPIETGNIDLRNSPVLDVVAILKADGVKVKISDPNLHTEILNSTAEQYGVGVASKDDIVNCSVFARFENYDLTIKKQAI